MSGSKRGGERVLESRHLIALFLGVVLLCCVFFTLGYVMGKTQYGNTTVQAASLENAPKPLSARETKAASAPQAASPDWDFYTEKKTTDVPLKSSQPSASASGPPSEPVQRAESNSPVNTQPVREAPAPASTPRASNSPPPARFRAPRMSRNAIVLQIAAMRHEGDALALADVLQRKGFPAFVVIPPVDSFYRVQVGPFDSQAIGDKAKQSLQREGFKAIYRR